MSINEAQKPWTAPGGSMAYVKEIRSLSRLAVMLGENQPMSDRSPELRHLSAKITKAARNLEVAVSLDGFWKRIEAEVSEDKLN